MIIMSTRGVVGFRKDGQDKIMYNGSDSCPSYCGANVIRAIQEHSNEEFSRLFDQILLVKYGTPIAERDITPDFNELINNPRNTFHNDNYTCIIIDHHIFLQDSLYCEWGYIINLDENCLELWRGFQTKPQQNRYKLTKQQAREFEDDKKTHSYYNCAIIAKWDLDAIRESEIDMNSFEMGVCAGEQNGSKDVPETNKYLSFRSKPPVVANPATEQKASWLYVEE